MNLGLPGRRTALIVCHAMSIAMTVVLPVPVASFRATRSRPGFDWSFACLRCSVNLLPSLPRCGATSVSQMMVSAASTWQKNGREPLNSWCRQCCNSRAVSGVTCHWFGFGRLRHRSTRWRSSLMIEVGSYCCCSVERPWSAWKARSRWPWPRLRFFGLGTGVMNSARRRLGISSLVGWPSPSSSQC